MILLGFQHGAAGNWACRPRMVAVNEARPSLLRQVERAGDAPASRSRHMLRHARGFALANAGHGASSIFLRLDKIVVAMPAAFPWPMPAMTRTPPRKATAILRPLVRSCYGLRLPRRTYGLAGPTTQVERRAVAIGAKEPTKNPLALARRSERHVTLHSRAATFMDIC
jgi:hypothetical protein